MSLIKSIKKNLPEVTALLSGSMPQYIYGKNSFSDIPVFCFHSAKHPDFEYVLRFLKKNNFNTLNGDELIDRLSDRNYKNNGKDIVLTFDDGLASVWTVGLPLLLKYGIKIICFVLPGIIDEGENTGKTLDNYSGEDELGLVLNRDCSTEPLCNWKEIIEMHASGYVDIQSHGMFHMLISTSDKIVNFINPSFNAGNYGNTHIPVYNDEQSNLCRDFVLGHPVYENSPRLSGMRRFVDDYQLRAACAGHVKDNGNADFFKRPDWKKALIKFVGEYRSTHHDIGAYEHPDENNMAMLEELRDSKMILENRLNNKIVNHFCFPWFVASSSSIKLANIAGYEALHLGATLGFRPPKELSPHPFYVRRLQEEYLMHLPGAGSISLIDSLKAKLNKRR